MCELFGTISLSYHDFAWWASGVIVGPCSCDAARIDDEVEVWHAPL